MGTVHLGFDTGSGLDHLVSRPFVIREDNDG